MTRMVYIALLAALSAGVAHAGQLSVSASRNVVGVNEIFYIQVKAQGSTISDPNVPPSSDFDIDVKSPQISRSQSVSMVNGRISTSLEQVWRFAASASRKGRFMLPPITVEIDGKVETGPDIMVTVEATAPLRPNAPRQRGATADRNQREDAGDDQPRKQLTVDDIVIIESFVDKTEVYQGERLLLTWQFWVLDSRGFDASRPTERPSVEGFYEGTLEEALYSESRGGYDYQVREWRQPLYATGSGDYVIGPWQWDGVVQYPNPGTGILARSQRSYRTPPVEVKVLPLPPRPDGFTGAVGNFELRSSLLDNGVTQGVPTTLNVRVVGEGNPDAIGAPVMPELSWGHVSDAETEIRRPEGEAAWAVEKIFTYQITPREAGALTISPIRFVYFSPEEKNYITLKTEAREVVVEPSAENGDLVVIGESAPQETQGVRILGEDVLAIVKESDGLAARGSGVPLNLALAVLPPALYAALHAWRRRRRRLEQDSAYARRHFARSTALKRLRNMDAAADPVAEMHGAVTQYLADALGAARAGLTSQDATRLLAERGAPDDLQSTFVKVLRACERGRYGGATLSKVEVEALRNAALTAIDDVERLVPKEGR